MKSGSVNVASSARRTLTRKLLMGTALASAAASILTASPAFAENECGPTDEGTVTCTVDGNPYPNGITYLTPGSDPLRDPGLDPDAPVFDLTVNLDPGVVVESGDNGGVAIIGFNDGSATLNGGTDTAITTTGVGATGVIGLTNYGDLTINTDSITTSGRAADGINANTNSGDITIDANSTITTGNSSSGMNINNYAGDTSITAGSVSTSGYYSNGIYVYAGNGNISINAGEVTTTGFASDAISARAISGDIVIDADTVNTEGDYANGIRAVSFGGDATVDVTAGDITTSGYAASGAIVQGATASLSVDNITTSGDYGYGAVIFATGAGGATVESTGTIATSGFRSIGVFARAYNGGDVTVDVNDVSTAGYLAAGVNALSTTGNVTITAGSVTTEGDYSRGVISSAANGISAVTVGDVATTGDGATAVYSYGLYSNVTVNGDVSTTGDNAAGVASYGYYTSDVVNNGTVSTEGANSNGITSVSLYPSTVSGDGSVSTAGSNSYGIYAVSMLGDVSVAMGSVETSGVGSVGVYAASAYNATIDVGSVTTSGYGANGIVVTNTALSSLISLEGDIDVTADTVSTTGDRSTGIFVYGVDDGTITVDAGTVSTTGILSAGISATGPVADVSVTADTVSTEGDYSAGIIAGSLVGNVSINSTGSITTAGYYSTAAAAVSQYGVGQASITVNDVTTTGVHADGAYAYGHDASVTVNGDLSTSGDYSPGVVAIGLAGDATVVNNGSITTTGFSSEGIYAGAYYDVAISGAGSVTTSGDLSRGIDAYSYSGSISIATGDVATSGDASQGIRALAYFGDVSIDAASIATQGDASDGIAALSLTGAVEITSTGTISTQGDNAFGVYASTILGDSDITVNNVSTTGDDSVGVQASGYNASVTVNGDLSTSGTDGYYGFGSDGVQVIGQFGTATATINGSVTTSGDYSTGVFARGYYDATVVNNGAIATSGENADGVSVTSDYGDVFVTNDGSVATTGTSSRGIVASTYYNATVDGGGSVSTTGDYSAGIAASAGYSVSVTAGSISTTGTVSTAVTVYGNLDATVDVGTVSTTGSNSLGILAGSGGDVTITADSVSTTGANSDGIRAATFYNGDIQIMAGDVGATGVNSNAITALGFAGDVDIMITGDATATRDDAIVIIAGGRASVGVASGGSIRGGVNGITVDSADGTRITNAGLISGRTGFAIDATGGAVTVVNSGTIRGRVSLTDNDDAINNSGSFIATGNSDFGAGADRFRNSGTLRLSTTDAPQSVTFANLETFNNAGGLVDLRNGVVGDMLTLPGAFTGSGTSRLGLDITTSGGPTTTDRLNVGTAAGTTEVELALTGNAFLTSGVTVVQATAASSPAAFQLPGGVQQSGLIDYQIVYRPATFAYQLVGTPGATVFHALKVSEAAESNWYRSADAVTAHLASLRDGEWGSADAKGGIWFESFGGVDKRDQTSDFTTFGSTLRYDSDYKQDYFGGQIGADFGAAGDEGGFVFGVTGGYQNSTLRFSSNADRFEYDVANVGVYGGFKAGPFFVNGLAKYDHYWVDAASSVSGFRDDFNGNAYGGQLEVGLRFGADKFFAEPVASIAYVHTDTDTLSALGQSIDFDNNDGLRGKAGLRVGSSFDNGGSKITVYAAGMAVHEFEGRNGITFNSGGQSVSYDNRRIPTYGQATLGFNIATPGGVTGFIEATGDFSGDYKGAGGRAGLKIQF